jgi:hypothetical protein
MEADVVALLQATEIKQQWERPAEIIALALMQRIDAPECRARARYCRELAMSTGDSVTEKSLLEMAHEFDEEAVKLEGSLLTILADPGLRQAERQ